MLPESREAFTEGDLLIIYSRLSARVVTSPHFLAAGETASCSRRRAQATGTAPPAALSAGPIAPPPEPRSVCSLPHDRTTARLALAQPWDSLCARPRTLGLSPPRVSHFIAAITERWLHAELCAE